MLEPKLREQLQNYLQRLNRPVRLTASLDGSQESRQLQELLEQVAALDARISLHHDTAATRYVPSFAVEPESRDAGIRFAGIPLGHEFSSLVLALLQSGGIAPKIPDGVRRRIEALEGEFEFETFVSLGCQNCPEVVQALNTMALLNPRIRHTMIDGALFEQEVAARRVQSVPAVYLNGKPFAQGRMGVEELLAKLDASSAQREARSLGARAPYDVLIVGGGPAAAAAAVYAARKGVRTGIVAERFGGQLLDTLGIENLIAVKHTEGPQLAAALESQVREHDVDVMNLQRATALRAGTMIEVQLEHGAVLRSRSVILATGARWRELGVPGEREYRGHGVAYCPHCDGPLFKGKRVAVVGGGNSGVEAAIDLAGIVSQVTLLEYDARLRADDVLQRKLRSLPNVRIITSAETRQVLGADGRVKGLIYDDRVSGKSQALQLDGVFVQIGLVPSTDWLQGTLALSARREIEVDARGQTSLPGVFAAGDATTTPYKQIVIAMGEGARAALGAFEHLLRSPVAVTAVAA